MPDIPLNPVRVRMPPSPTGPLHMGTARTMLFNWLFARQNNGVLVVRIEDTDKERSEKKYEDELLTGFAWLGLDWDEGPFPNTDKQLPILENKGAYGPYRQSERTEIYKKYLQELIDKKEAYYCYCTKEDLEAQRQMMLAQGLPPKYNGHCRNLTEPPAGKTAQVIRFKVAEVKVEFKDLVRGKVVFDAALLGDQVIAKDLDSPLYNFAVVVDDELMKITHVIRGEDHLSNTPKQILMQRALGFSEPIYAHIPLILNADRSKMSKRFTDVALSSYREKGYLPDAIVNFLALLGWHPKDDKEIFSKKELIAQFDISRVQSSGAIFNPEKLDWLNREHIKQMSDKELLAALQPFLEKDHLAHPQGELFLKKFVAIERTRANTLQDFIDHGRFFFELPEYAGELLVWKNSSKEEAIAALNMLRKELGSLPQEYFADKPSLSQEMVRIIGEQKRGVILWPLRVALSGSATSPDPVDIMEVLGKNISMERIDIAIKKLEQ